MASLASRRACAQATTRGNGQRPSLAFGSVVARPVSPVMLREPVVVAHILGGGGGPEDKKFLSRDEEPEEYWSSKSEKAGANPFQDPLAWVGIIAIFFPFVLLLIAVSAGFIDLSVYRG